MTYTFVGGYPSEKTIEAAYDAADYIRAVQCYKYFFPAVSGRMIFRGNEAVGVIPNVTFGVMEATPAQLGLTLNADTPYGPIMVDVSDGPLVVDVPAGPIMGVVMGLDQRWLADIGIPGPDGNKGGKFLLVPPHWSEPLPTEGFHIVHTDAYRLHVGVRAVPMGGDEAKAVELLRSIRIFPLNPEQWSATPNWIDVPAQDTSPNSVQGIFEFWTALDEYVQREPVLERHRVLYGELAALGIIKGQQFAPDQRMREILERAAHDADAQMRVQSLADRRPDRVVWPDRTTWEWVTLRPENGDFQAEHYTDVVAREVWFYQAIGTSPVMFRREPGQGMAYWYGGRDSSGAWLDGGNHYVLTVPLPVPDEMFWSVTVYDAQTRSQIDTGKAALRSLFDLGELTGQTSIDLHFAPECPPGEETRWVRTIPGRGWFTYVRVYGPTPAAFDGSWKPSDIVKQ